MVRVQAPWIRTLVLFFTPAADYLLDLQEPPGRIDLHRQENYELEATQRKSSNAWLGVEGRAKEEKKAFGLHNEFYEG